MLHCNMRGLTHILPDSRSNEFNRRTSMSKQLAISAAFSIFTMAAFVLLASPDGRTGFAPSQTGAATQVTAPASEPVFPALFSILG